MKKRVRLKSDIENKKEVIIPDITFHAELKEIKGDDDGDLFIEGFASTSDIDRVNDIVEPSAFKKTLKEFMKNPIVMLNHGGGMFGNREGIGKIVEAEIKPKGLWVKAFISKAEESLRIKIKEGIYKAFSFGFRILDSDMIKKAGKELRRVTNLELLEVSVVSIPANRRALFDIAKGFELGSDLIYENGYIEEMKEEVDLANKKIESMESKIEEFKTTYDSVKEKWIKEGEENTNEKESDLEEIEEKPAPEETENEIRIRRRNPNLFQKDSFRRITIKKASPRVFAIIGKLIGKTSTTVQAYRFPKSDGWTIAKASKWVKDNGKIYTDIDFKSEELYDSIEDDIKGNTPNKEEIKILEEEIADLKAGRVLSSSNRNTLEKTMSSMKVAISLLDSILQMGQNDDTDEESSFDSDVEKDSDDENAVCEEVIEEVCNTLNQFTLC